MDSYEVIVYDTAEADIHGVIDYISKVLREPGTAQAMLLRFREAILSLRSMPERFPIVQDSYLASLGIRITAVGRYLIFFIVRKSTHRVDVVRVLYGKRSWTELLKEAMEQLE